VRSFGIEEEYLLLDECTGRPVDRAAEMILATRGSGRLEHEYFSSKIEVATPVCEEGDEAEAALASLRADAAGRARRIGVVVAGTGLPPVGGDVAGTVAPKERYRRIEAAMRSAAENQYTTGTHVHVEIPSREAGVDVLSRLARWAPALLAMTANSPLWCGEATGFASWRHIVARSWPLNGYPEAFESAAHYRRAVEQLITTGVVPDSGLLTWVVRLSENYPTVELRIADAQLEARDAVAFAVIVRALVHRALGEHRSGVPRPGYASAEVNGAIWLAARNGLDAELIDPFAGSALPAFTLINRMIGGIEHELVRFGDLDRVDAYLRRLRESGGPAARQLSAFARGGIGGLLDLYRNAAGATVVAA